VAWEEIAAVALIETQGFEAPSIAPLRTCTFQRFSAVAAHAALLIVVGLTIVF
jgi:hypothetical protein